MGRRRGRRAGGIGWVWRLLGAILAVALVAAGIGWWLDDGRLLAGAVRLVALLALALVGWLFRWRRRRERRRSRGPRRVPIPGRVRQYIYRRDRETCRYCGRRGREVRLELDHVFPVARGGGDEIENLVTSCRECNRAKGATILIDARAMDRFVAERRDWADTLTRAARRRALIRNVGVPISLLLLLGLLYLVLTTFVW